jgi:hypothetical protein
MDDENCRGRMAGRKERARWCETLLACPFDTRAAAVAAHLLFRQKTWKALGVGASLSPGAKTCSCHMDGPVGFGRLVHIYTRGSSAR